MHELDTIAAERDALDDAELEALEEQSQLVDDLAGGARRGAGPRRGESRQAAAALAAVEGRDRRRDRRADGRRGPTSRRSLEGGVLADYERRRKHHGGVAVAQLDGRSCSGCHLDLSTSELETGARRRRRGSWPTARSAAASSSRRAPRRVVFFWFIGTAIVAVWYVFRDPRFDYRLLVVGSVLPLGRCALRARGRAGHALDALAGVQRRPARRRSWRSRQDGSRSASCDALVGPAHRHVPPPRVRRCVGNDRRVLVAVRRLGPGGAPAARGAARVGESRFWRRPASPSSCGSGVATVSVTRCGGATRCGPDGCWPREPDRPRDLIHCRSC